MSHWMFFLAGGAIIGGAAGLLLLLTGRIMGASGLTVGAFFSPLRRRFDLVFVLAMIITGGVIARFYPALFNQPDTPLAQIALAGLLVGFGSLLGSGCTSGHGICGIARFSPRSLVSTCVFVGVAVLTFYLVNHLL